MDVPVLITPENREEVLRKALFSGNNIPPVASFDSTLIYTSQSQLRVSTDITNFLYALTTRLDEPFLHEDAARGALIAGVKFTIQSYYNKNKRQFTSEHKKKILEDIEKVIDTQLDSIHLQQVLAH